jgi:hypothetical protein
VQRMKLLGLAGTIAVAVMLIGTAGAGAKPVGVKKVDLSTRAAVAKYLHSIGVSPKGVVIQRGRFNYAGPNCPGKKWTCTTSRRVVQVASDEHGDNSFSCVGNIATYPPDCMIVQTGAHNRATCREHIETSLPSVIEHCSIKQTGQDNKAVVDMLVIQHGSPSQYAEQRDDVTQINNGGSYSHNESDVDVRILQTTGGAYGYGAYGAAADPANQTQDTSQDTQVDQSSNNPTTNDSEANSSFLQIARAGDGSSSQSQNTTPGPDNNVSVFQGNNGSKNDSDIFIGGSSAALAGNGYPGIHQTQGSESGGLAGSSNQSSEGAGAEPKPGSAQAAPIGRSTLDATIYENMLALGPSTAVQEQHGPTACCSYQFGPGTEKIRENIHLFASNDPGGNAPCTGAYCPVQTDLNLLNCDAGSPMGCDGLIRANVNGTTGMASCFNTQHCHIGVACSSVTSEGGVCVPLACSQNFESSNPCPTPCFPYCGSLPRGASARSTAFARQE